ncbi:MAG: hypothetical protein IPM18_04490 [Phycisphaerales bacterium]|nr:hypothetical protein [Phycisphaerales bacterium]
MPRYTAAPVLRWWCVAFLSAGLTGGGVASAQSPPEPTSEPLALVELSRGIEAYLRQDNAAAALVFEGLLERYPEADFHVTCHYYLGLIRMDEGLMQANNARGAADEAARADFSARAIGAFRLAQDHLSRVVDLADPTARTVDAALLLGIAQLASDDTTEGREQLIGLAQRAERTLDAYARSDAGRGDRFGRFYLAVARYRLADAYRKPPRRTLEFGSALHSAEENLREALALADAELAAETLTADEYAGFRTVVRYYEGLLAILRRENSQARALLVEVATAAGEVDLGANARDIIAELDRVEIASPLPIQLPVPAPIGPLEFDARLRLGNWYDSNVILLGRDTTLPRGYKRSDDYQFGLSADFNISRYISSAEVPWIGESLTIGIGGGTSNLWQPNIPEFNVSRYPARAFVNWQPVPDIYLGFQYEYSYTELGHDPFISSHRFTPVVSKVWRGAPTETERRGADLGRSDVYFIQDDRNYFDPLPDFRLNRDGVYRAVGFRHQFNLTRARNLGYMQDYFNRRPKEAALFGEEHLSFYLGYEFRDESTVGTEFSLRGHSMIWGLHVPLPYRLAFELDSEFSWAGYSGASIFDFERKQRDDFLQRYYFSFVYTLVARGELPELRTLNARLRAGVEMTFQDSNIWNRLGQDIYEYGRTVYGVQLEVDF